MTVIQGTSDEVIVTQGASDRIMARCAAPDRPVLCGESSP